MKQIPKKQLDKVIGLTREYWKDGDTDILGERIRMCESLNIGWCPALDLMDGILQNSGFCPDASNELIYDIIRLLGWEVMDDEKHTPE